MQSNIESKIKKIVRETFQSFYLNRLLKEDYSDLLKTIPPAKAKELDMLYNFWMSKKNFQFNELNPKDMEFILLKAIEEYKQTRDKKIHDKISYLFYPTKESNLANIVLTNTISSKNLGAGIVKKLKSRFKEVWKDALEEIILNAWTSTIADQNVFDRIINSYDIKSAKNLFLTILQQETLRLSSKSAAIKRGGNAEFRGVDDLSDTSSEFDDGSIDVDSINVNTFKDMLRAFADEAKDIYGLKEMHKYILDAFFKQGKSYEEMLKDRPDLFPGKTLSNMSTIVTNSLGLNKNIQSIASQIGPKFGFPSNWLIDLIKSRNLQRIKDFFTTIRPSYRDLTPRKKETDSYLTPNTKEKEDLVYEKKKP